METLSPERVAAALSAAMPEAHIEVVEFSRQPIPSGELRFPPSGLRADQATRSPLLWHGVVSASGRDDFPVWAKVRIQVSGTRVTATEALVPGRPIERAQLRAEPCQGPPGLPDLSQVVGWEPRRLIPAGTVIERQWLDVPADVLRGERVRVEIRSGQARVLLEGQAESSGRRGEVIGVRNPANGRILRATVAERGRVVVSADEPRRKEETDETTTDSGIAGPGLRAGPGLGGGEEEAETPGAICAGTLRGGGHRGGARQ
jgi:flagella basal body P-ring formation protein FlgA